MVDIGSVHACGRLCKSCFSAHDHVSFSILLPTTFTYIQPFLKNSFYCMFTRTFCARILSTIPSYQRKILLQCLTPKKSICIYKFIIFDYLCTVVVNNSFFVSANFQFRFIVIFENDNLKLTYQNTCNVVIHVVSNLVIRIGIRCN